MQNQWVDVMKMKRAIHEEVINKVRQQRSSVPASKVKLLFVYDFLFRCSLGVLSSCFHNTDRKSKRTGYSMGL